MKHYTGNARKIMQKERKIVRTKTYFCLEKILGPLGKASQSTSPAHDR